MLMLFLVCLATVKPPDSRVDTTPARSVTSPRSASVNSPRVIVWTASWRSLGKSAA